MNLHHRLKRAESRLPGPPEPLDPERRVLALQSLFDKRELEWSGGRVRATRLSAKLERVAELLNRATERRERWLASRRE